MSRAAPQTRSAPAQLLSSPSLLPNAGCSSAERQFSHGQAAVPLRDRCSVHVCTFCAQASCGDEGCSTRLLPPGCVGAAVEAELCGSAG